MGLSDWLDSTSLSSTLKNLIQRCLKTDPRERFSLEEVSFHPSMDVEYEGRLGRGKVKEKYIIDLFILHAYILKKWITRDGDSFKNIK